MSSTLLRCTICPKLPSFSDTSHLLTHISSKGHLAHLHKIQVRSHQELAAGHQLALYNQWYQEHGVAEMLSTRLQQKDAKKLTRQAGTGRKPKQDRRQNISSNNDKDFSLGQAPDLSSYGQMNELPKENMFKTSKTSGTTDAGLSELHCSSRVKIYEADLSPYSYPEYDVSDDCPPQTESVPPECPSTPKLKGLVWPGMRLFDAANDETKRKRNQKKDGIVLRRMEQDSILVRPYETVCSASGELLKERHLDSLEDDSLVDGESPLMKQSPKRKNQASYRSSERSNRRTKRAKTFPRQKLSPTLKETNVISQPPDGVDLQVKQSSAAVTENVICDNKTNGYEEGEATGVMVTEDSERSVLGTKTPSTTVRNSFLNAQLPAFIASEPLDAIHPWMREQSHKSEAANPLKAHGLTDVVFGNWDDASFHQSSIPLVQKTSKYRQPQVTNPLAWKDEENESCIRPFKAMSDLLTSPFRGFHSGFTDSGDNQFSFENNPLIGSYLTFGHLDGQKSQQDYLFGGHCHVMSRSHDRPHLPR